MIVTAETRMEDARRSLERAEKRMRVLRMEEIAANASRDYVAATSAARARFLQQEIYDQALAVILRGGR